MTYVIYLNGASSAGKSTIVRALQKASSKPLFAIGLDLLIREMLPEKLFLNPDEGMNHGFYWKDITVV